MPRRPRRVRALHLTAHDGALDDGAHTFEVRAVDAAGNVDPAPGVAAVRGRRRRARHDARVRARRARSTTPRRRSRSARTRPGTTFSCSLDGAEFTAVRVARSRRRRWREGAHTFAVRARDASGNVDASPATRSFTVDLTPPAAPQVVSGPGRADDGARARVRLRGDRARSRAGSTGRASRGAFEPCASPKSFGALAAGRLRVRRALGRRRRQRERDAARVHR